MKNEEVERKDHQWGVNQAKRENHFPFLF